MLMHVRTLGSLALSLVLLGCGDDGGGGSDSTSSSTTDSSATAEDGPGPTVTTDPSTSTSAPTGTDTSASGSESTTAPSTGTGTGSSTGGSADTGGTGGVVAICEGDEPEDGFWIQDISIAGDELMLDVASSGGCEEHDWGLCWDGTFLESNPVQAVFTVTHDSHADPCEAIVMAQLSQDLTALKQAWQMAYQMQNGSIIIQIKGQGQSVQYDF